MSTTEEVRRNRQDERSASTRSQLMTLGLELMVKTGYAGTSIRDILSRSGLTIGAFYHHFASKEDFFLSLLEKVTSGGSWGLTQAESSSTLEEAFQKVAYPGRKGGQQDVWQSVFVEVAQATNDDPEYRARLAALYRAWVDDLAGWVAVNQRRGLVRDDQSAETLAALVFAALQGEVLMRKIFGPDSREIDEAVLRILRP